MRIRSAAAIVALLATASAPPPPVPLSPPPLQHARGDDSPVRCRPRPATGRKSFVAPRAIVHAAPMAPPPPPPGPPPAPVPPAARGSAMSSPNIVMTGGRIALPHGTPGNRERYAGKAVADVQDVATAPVSTFSVDVDTGAYANVRRFLRDGQPVPAAAVRTEELLNYFRYAYPKPANRAEPFSVSTDVARTPWNRDTRLLRIGLRAYDVTGDTRPAANLVFLVDVSGSMDSPDKLPLVRAALTDLAGRLGPRDRVSIVVYAGAAGIVLEPTGDQRYVAEALACLEAGGATAGGEGLALAYATARRHFVTGGVNRILLATDGDFNVGLSSDDAVEALVKRNRDEGVTLTTLGFGTGNYNEAMMERIADAGNGNYAYIDSPAEARKVLDEELEATLVTVARDVKVQVEFNPAAVSQYRLIGYENRALREQDFRNDAVDAGDIGAGHQVTALYEIAPAGTRGWTEARRYPGNAAPTPTQGSAELAYVRLRWKAPAGGASREIARAVPAATLRGAAAPAGDMAFAAAVAAYGQKLRGDPLLARYPWPAVRTLAQQAPGPWRAEFAELVGRAARVDAPAGG